MSWWKALRTSCSLQRSFLSRSREEFSVILPETGPEGATKAGQRICDAIAESKLPTIGQFTASIGVATYPLNAISKEGLVKAADEALYKAKNAGRNQVATSDMVLSDSTTVA